MRTFLAIYLCFFLFLTLNAQETKKLYYNEAVNELHKDDLQKPLVFVDFWATWCAPCISSMPHTLNLQKLFKDQVNFVYISNEPSYKIKNFLTRKKIHFHALVDNSRKTEEEFNVQSIPNSFLLNPEGKIIWHGKPTEMSIKLLQSFVDFYKDNQGNKNRFVFTGEKKEESEKWNEFSCNKTKLFFYKDTEVENIFYQNKNEFFLSGDIRYIFSFINDYPIDRVSSTLPSLHFRFKGVLTNLGLFKKMIKKYFKKNHSFHINKNNSTKEVYFIKELNDQEFLNEHVYNYERGKAQFIQNDISIKIDNASPKEIFVILNNITPYTFIYKGKNQKIYDWNLIYSPPEALLQQLQEDLNFIIEKDIKKVSSYEIVPNNM